METLDYVDKVSPHLDTSSVAPEPMRLFYYTLQGPLKPDTLQCPAQPLLLDKLQKLAAFRRWDKRLLQLRQQPLLQQYDLELADQLLLLGQQEP